MTKNNLSRYPLSSLPTNGVPYPEDWSIEITPYAFGQSTGVRESDITQRRFYNCMLDGVYTNFDKSLLVLEDILFIGSARKLVSSKSSKVILKSVCPECLNENAITLDLKDVVRFSESKITREKYPVKVTFSKYIGWFSYLTLNESLELMKSKQSKGTETAANLAKRTVKLVELVGDENIEKVVYDKKQGGIFDFESLKTLYDSFRDEDSETLEQLLELFEDIKLLPIKVKCSDEKCGTEYEQDLSIGGLSQYLSPFRDISKRENTNNIDV